MERVRNSSTLRIAFDLIVGVVLLTCVAIFFGGTLDMPITILIALIIVLATGLVIRQNRQIAQATMEDERA